MGGVGVGGVGVGSLLGVGTSGGVGVGSAVATGISSSEFIGSVGGISSGVGVGTAVATVTSLSAAFFGSGLAVLACKPVPFPGVLARFSLAVLECKSVPFPGVLARFLFPFPDFLGRFASWQAVSGISECFVGASPLMAFSLARVSNR